MNSHSQPRYASPPVEDAFIPIKFWVVKTHSCHLDSMLNEPQKISHREGTYTTLRHHRFPLSCGMPALNALICYWRKATWSTPAWGDNSITRLLPRWPWTSISIVTFWQLTCPGTQPGTHVPDPLLQLGSVKCSPTYSLKRLLYNMSVWPNYFIFTALFGRMGIGNTNWKTPYHFHQFSSTRSNPYFKEQRKSFIIQLHNNVITWKSGLPCNCVFSFGLGGSPCCQTPSALTSQCDEGSQHVREH